MPEDTGLRKVRWYRKYSQHLLICSAKNIIAKITLKRDESTEYCSGDYPDFNYSGLNGMK